jgi:hypothetical protein
MAYMVEFIWGKNALQWFRAGAHDEDTQFFPLSLILKDYPIGPNGIGNFLWFSHFYCVEPISSYCKEDEGLFGAKSALERANYFLEKIKEIIGCKNFDDLSDDEKRKIFDYFGRILHLIEDMGVPNHVKGDAHPFKKEIEEFAQYNWSYIIENISLD